MLTQLYKKLNSITALKPVKDNEVLIRNLVHRLLNEINLAESSDLLTRDKELIRQRCLSCIRLLNSDIAMNSSPDDYVYETYNLTSLISNVLTACELFLSKSEIRITISHCNNIYLEFPLKLMITAVVGLVRLFCKICTEEDIRFSLQKTKKHTVLLAECDNIKPDALSEECKTLALLKKTAELTSGTFLTAMKGSAIICALSFESRKADMRNVKPSPDYIELLSDKMSEVYIGLS